MYMQFFNEPELPGNRESVRGTFSAGKSSIINREKVRQAQLSLHGVANIDSRTGHATSRLSRSPLQEVTNLFFYFP
jgi:hypothetical protein